MFAKTSLLLTLSLVLAGLVLAACSGPALPTSMPASPTAAPSASGAPTIDVNAVQTEAAMSVIATLTASAPTIAPPTTQAPTGSPPSASPTPTWTAAPIIFPPTKTHTPGPPTPTPPRLLAANLGGGGNLVGRLLYVDTGSAIPTYTSQLSFEVVANNTKAGSSNGAGIDSVDFEIDDNLGNPVYQHRETAVRYCSFRGNETCNVFVFSSNGYKWPDSDKKITGVDLRLHNAMYTVNVNVNGKNGGNLSGSLDFNIQCSGCVNP